MENREILIANTKDQCKYRVVTNATTLGELQDAIARNEGVYKMVGDTWINNTTSINIDGLTFTEGISKTQLLSRDSLLPTNVMFKGQPTNNLVMLLTNTNKQIASGAISRKEAYAKVKELNIADTIQKGEGKNYTQVKTDVLEEYILANTEDVVEPTENEEEEPVNVHLTPHNNTIEWLYDGIKKMVKENSLYTEDVVVLADLLDEYAKRLVETTPKVTVNDVDDMLNSIL
jgi:hypothetical protein